MGNELTRKIMALYEEQPVDRTMATKLSDAHTWLEFARRFCNDVVTDTKALRIGPLVRALRSAGITPEPEYFGIIDGLTTAQL